MILVKKLQSDESANDSLTADGVCKRRWRADGDRECRRLGVGRRRRRHGRRVPVEKDEPGLQLLLVFANRRKLRMESVQALKFALKEGILL